MEFFVVGVLLERRIHLGQSFLEILLGDVAENGLIALLDGHGILRGNILSDQTGGCSAGLPTFGGRLARATRAFGGQLRLVLLISRAKLGSHRISLPEAGACPPSFMVHIRGRMLAILPR
ncbi:MAG: hypothetical protein AMXMBFR33_04940 [Candidatus Xenobia bacterium]